MALIGRSRESLTGTLCPTAQHSAAATWAPRAPVRQCRNTTLPKKRRFVPNRETEKQKEGGMELEPRLLAVALWVERVPAAGERTPQRAP
jgi:hypothetical protein